MAIIGVFEDEYGIPVADPGRIIYTSPGTPPTPLIPTGVPMPPGEIKYLSILTPVYTNLVSFSSGVSIAATYTFTGYAMMANYVFTCPNGVTTAVAIPSMFAPDLISWYDKDKSIKNTPEDPTLTNLAYVGGTPLLTGNHQDNPHVDGDDIIVKLESGKRYVIRGAVCDEESKIEEADKAITEMMETGAQCYYKVGDVDGFNNK